MQNFTNILTCWRKLPNMYALWRMGLTFEESRSYNTTDRILLTFDDSGTRKNIYGILDVLDKESVKAAFFLTGEWAKDHEDIVQQIQSRGHWIASHCYHHYRLDKLSDTEIKYELTEGLQTKLMRPPYGAYNGRVRRIIHALGFRIAYWTIDSLDWKGISVAEIHDNVLPNLHPGACVLMHLNTPHTLEALPGLIAGIRSQGFELCHDGTEIKL